MNYEMNCKCTVCKMERKIKHHSAFSIFTNLYHCVSSCLIHLVVVSHLKCILYSEKQDQDWRLTSRSQPSLDTCTCLLMIPVRRFRMEMSALATMILSSFSVTIR